MARSSSTQHQPANPLGSPSVVGLEGGRELARRQQRRRRLQHSATVAAGVVVATAVLVVAAFVGFELYQEQQVNDRAESELRRAEIAQRRSGDNVSDAIDELEEQPIWNGPGNPSFGVGDGDEDGG